jgi:Zn-finger protein
MLLDAKSQRAKSWACENCENFKIHKDNAICRRCFWAFPDGYEHVAMQEQRRTDIVWQDKDVAIHDALKLEASALGIEIAELLRDLGRKRLKR